MVFQAETLFAFEKQRQSYNYVPPVNSDSFYEIGEGEMSLHCLRGERGNERFDISLENGVIHMGEEFQVNGNVYNGDLPYNNMTIKTGSKLIVDGTLTFHKGDLLSHGELYMPSGSSLIIDDNSNLIMYADSTWSMDEGCAIDIISGHITVYGKVLVPLSMARRLIKNPNITFDTSAVIDLSDVDVARRPTSLRGYEYHLRNIDLAVQSTNYTELDTGTMRGTWLAGNVHEHNQLVQLHVHKGNIALGDFRVSILGVPTVLKPDTQVIKMLQIDSGATLSVTEVFQSHGYLFTDLYVGAFIANNDEPGELNVYGTLEVSGNDATLTIDRKGHVVIHEGGVIRITNGAHIVSAYNEDKEVLTVHGTLILENMESLINFDPANIQIYGNGKVVILNHYEDSRDTSINVLYTFPNGFADTELNRIFGDRLEQLEYHIQSNTAIELDQSFRYFGRDLTHWFGGYRIEDACRKGIVVWHDGGTILVQMEMLDWSTDVFQGNLTLSQLFYHISTDPYERTQEVADNLRDAGLGDIRFIVTRENGEEYIIMMPLAHPTMQSVRVNSMTSTYTVRTDRDGEGFVRTGIPAKISEIISPKAKQFAVRDQFGRFTL